MVGVGGGAADVAGENAVSRKNCQDPMPENGVTDSHASLFLYLQPH